MKYIDKNYYISPSSLNNFVSCKYLIKNEIKYLNKEIKKSEESFEQKLLKKFGLNHEKKHLDLFKKKLKKTISINQDDSEKNRSEKTIKAIKDGFDLIYHAYLVDENFRGEVDFLKKTSKKSDLGNYSYKVFDTKISRKPNPRHILQITAYSYMLSKIQGVLPNKMYLIDGSDKTHSYKPKEFLDFFLFTKKNFENYLKNIDKEKIYPEKCQHCELCNFKEVCNEIWEKDNYINQVAKINKSQIEKLKNINIKTVEKLSKINIDQTKIDINKQVLANLIAQAKLQEKKRITGEDQIEILDPDKGKGFYKLPKPDDGDLFFDIEGFPQEDGRGFEYLYGLYFKDKNNYKFDFFWAKDFKSKYEKENFIHLINFLKEHFNKFPKAHIYHYNTYEKRALRQLASLYSSDFPEGSNFVDILLRSEKLVDLYLIVNQCVRTSAKDMSLKSIEKILYDFNRKGDVTKAEESVRLYDQWLITKDKKIKENIIEYNKEDCISTYQLREFLIQKKPEPIEWFSITEEVEKKSKDKKTWEEIESSLLKSLNSSKLNNNPLTDIVKNLVGFHRREQKPEWWAIFDRMEKTHDELENDRECISSCVLQSDKPEKIKGGVLFSYKFNDQEYKLKKGDDISDAHTRASFGSVYEIIENSPNNNIIIVKLGDRKFSKMDNVPNFISLTKSFFFKINSLEKALNKFIQDYIDFKGKNYSCIMDLLNRSVPNLQNIEPGKNLISEDKDITDESIKVVKAMKNTCLSIQGPPGTGKTYNSAKIIVELLKNKKKVGVSSHSHSTVINLLKEIERQAVDEGFKFSGVKKSDVNTLYEGILITNIVRADIEIKINDYSLFAGTTSFFSKGLNKKLDYLFIDEAGQVSLASTISAATSADNIILIGDHMQLSQPMKGTHNINVKLSSLDHILENKDTVPPHQGIFLRETRRLNKTICQYISDSFYDSRLIAHEVTNKRKLFLKMGHIGDEGIFYIPTDHVGNSQKSDEEADLIHKYYKKMIGKKYEDEKEKDELKVNHLMSIAPYNVQTNNIKQKLLNDFGDDTRVGTIDLFQGQEAKIVFISMTSSDSDNLPRHKSFFFSRNRLNVAISRAQNVAILCFNPNLLLAPANTIEEMKLINNFCKLLKFKINLNKVK